MHTINKYKNKIMAQLSDRLNRLAPSATLAMSQKSSEMKAQGIDVINMSVGEPDFNTPDNIKQAAKKAIDENYSRYSPVPGYPDLRKAIVAKLKNENGLEYTINEVIVGTGGKQRCIGTRKSRRRGYHSCTILGKLPTDGEIGRRYSGHCECGFRPGL